jgi:AcrR family transcriptional regulator
VTTAESRPPRPRDAAATRADLLRAAKRRFAFFGYERTTSRDIAADAGANVSLINRYFGSKEGLYEAVLRETSITPDNLGAGSGADLARILLDTLSPDAWPEYGHEHPMLLLLRGFSSDTTTNELRRRGLEQALQEFAVVLGSAASGEPPSAEATRQARLLFALLIGIITLRELLPDDSLGDPAALDLAGELTRLGQKLAQAD